MGQRRHLVEDAAPQHERIPVVEVASLASPRKEAASSTTPGSTSSPTSVKDHPPAATTTREVRYGQQPP